MSTKIYNETKESLIADIKSRLEDGIIEKSNADLIIKLINNAEDLNEAINIASLGTTYRRTGFHFDKRLEKLSNNIKYFKRNDELSFKCDDGKPTNTLIIGDNYDALQNLLIQYRGKIDVIYIDPPYGKDSMGEFAKTNYDNAITRDNLLSMLYNRLVLARELLKEEGVIFCSIDDRNQAYVKCLFDEIFDERNFVGMFMWYKSETPPNLSKKIKKNLEYILCYQKEKDQSTFLGFKTSSKSSDPSTKPQDAIKVWTFPPHTLITDFDDCIIEAGIYGTDKYPNILKNNLIVRNGTNENEVSFENRFIWKQETLIKTLPSIKMYLSSNLVLSYKRNQYNIPAPSNLIDDSVDVSTTEKAGDYLDTILGENRFDYPKPVDLIKYLLGFVNKEDLFVLDFFAGSGTTGEAVLDMNKKDNGKRKFILVQLNEDIDNALNTTKDPKERITLKNQKLLCDELKRPHKMSEITAERLRRVMTGMTLNGKTNFDWLKKYEPYGGSLEVYDIAEVNNYERKEGQSPFEVIDETLYGQDKFKNANDKIKWVCENFEHTQNEIDNDEEYIKMIEKNMRKLKGGK